MAQVVEWIFRTIWMVGCVATGIYAAPMVASLFN